LGDQINIGRFERRTGLLFPDEAEDGRTQKDKLDELRQETPERVEAKETTSLVREVPRAFDFQFVGEDAYVNGRPLYILQATPHPGYQAQANTASCSPK
jgi:hypothetical protein